MDLTNQAHEIDRLGVQLVAAVLAGERARLVGIVGQQRDDGNVAGVVVELERAGGRPVHIAAQLRLQQDDLRLRSLGGRDRGARVDGEQNEMAAPLQPLDQQVAELGVVFDDQDFRHRDPLAEKPAGLPPA